MGRPVLRSLSLRTAGFVWLGVGGASVVPDALPYASLALVAAILVTWGRGRSWHLWAAAFACWGVALLRQTFDPAGAWLTGVLCGGFPAFALGLVLLRLADRAPDHGRTALRTLRSV